MRSHALYLPALMIAATGAAVVALGLLFEPLRNILVKPVTLIVVGVLLVLFLRLLFDPKVRQGIYAANAELRGVKSWPGSFMPKPFDPEWGLFGSRMGDPPLQVVRVVSFAEFAVALLLSRHERPDLLILAAASFTVTLMLTIIGVGLNTQTQRL